MYKVASDRRQTTLHRGRPVDWVNGEARESFAEQLRTLQDGIKVLDARIQNAAVSGEDQKALGLMKFEMQNQCTELRKKAGLERKIKDGFDQIFVDMAKEMLPRVQFDMISRAAHREYDRRKQELDEARA